MSKVSTPDERAGVECPKKNGEMDKAESCTKCQYYVKCYSAVMRALGWME